MARVLYGWKHERFESRISPGLFHDSYSVPIPGCPLGSRYVIAEEGFHKAGEQPRGFTVGAVLDHKGTRTGGDVLFYGQPCFPTPEAAAAWAARRDHKRWAGLLHAGWRRARANQARGFLG